MDITKHAVVDSAPLHLKDASGNYMYDADGNPARIRLYGPGSKAYSQVESRQTQRALKSMEDNGGKPMVISPEERRKREAEDLASLTIAFENFTYSPASGKDGTELFQALYEDPLLGFITQQAAKFVGNWSSFKPGSATS